MATITTIQSTDILANSRAAINANFSNLNSAKVEGAAALLNAGKIVKVTAAGIVGESLVSESGTSVTVSGSLTVTGAITGSITGNAATVTNGVYTSGSYSDPAWLTISKSKVDLGNVENTALSTWVGSANITTLGTVTSGSLPWANVSGRPTAVSAFTNDAGYLTSASVANYADKTAANTFTAGAKQTMSQSASTAGFNLGGLSSDPSTPANGDLWINAGVLKVRQSAATKVVAYTDSNITGNAATVTNGVYTSGSYSDPSWLAISKAKVGLGSVENTALSSWAGSSNITTLGSVSAGSFPWANLSGKPNRTLAILIDGGGVAITSGRKAVLHVPCACTIDQWTVLADQSGSIAVDVKRSTYPGFPTTVSIVGAGNKPTLSSGQKNQATPSSWTSTALAAGDVIEFVVESASTVTQVCVSLRITI